MERMLVVVFENELKAYDGSRELKALDSEGSISIHSEAVIKKNEDGTITVKQEGDDFPIRTVGGTAVGALIGLLGGPVGLAVGALAGTFAGAVWDMDRAGVNADFLNEVSAKLTAGKWAVVSDVSEEWVTPVDTRMGALGGTVFRITRANVEHQQDARDVAAIKADIAQLKAEQAKSRADQKAKLQTKIDNMNKKLQTKLAQAKQKSEQQQKEAKTKVDALEKKAAKAKGDAKAAIEKRIADIKERAKKSSEEFDKWWNEEEIS
ncbi:MAG TPA: DUF1269 domain-containing protein [Candidatus Acidoferrum sp.]|nr:DUF1269 domain-containing protein [Candidatus Acidoferrum sp.]